MTVIPDIVSECPCCGSSFRGDMPGVLSSHGGGFRGDLMPGYGSPAGAIWESLLFACTSCGYTTYGPRTSDDQIRISTEVRQFAFGSLRAFVRRQEPILNAQPKLTSKYELYALQLDHGGAEDHFVADQLLRASWSARIRRRSDDVRRLQSLAAKRYEEALETTAESLIEEQVIARYLLIELYRLLGEGGLHRLHYERLRALRCEDAFS